MSRLHQNDSQMILARHAWVLAFAIPNRKYVGAIVPVQRNLRGSAFLIRKGEAVIAIQREVCIGTAINVQSQWIFWLLRYILQFRSNWQNGPGTNKYRNRVEGRGSRGFTAGNDIPRPEVVPLPTRR